MTLAPDTRSTFDVVDPAQFLAMPDDYQSLALHQMRVHVEGELSGADDYLQVFLPIAPSAYEKKVCCERAGEEYDHFLIGSAVLNDLGQSTDDMLTKRLEERELYASPEIHGVRNWEQRALFSFVGEAAVLDHIKEMAQSSYRPWAASFASIIRDELVHVAHGERITRQFAASPEGLEKLQAAIDEMWPFVRLLFGHPESWRSPLYVQFGLRQRSNVEAWQYFQSWMIPKLNRLGLDVPIAL